MEKYKEEYISLKQKLSDCKKEIEIINNKYSDEDWVSKIMEVIRELYSQRKWEDWYYEEDILNNYNTECWVNIEDISEMLQLFKKRKEIRRRMWFIKWLVLRNFLYSKKLWSR